MKFTFDSETGVITDPSGHQIRAGVSVGDAALVFTAMNAAAMYAMSPKYAKVFDEMLRDCREVQAAVAQSRTVARAIDR